MDFKDELPLDNFSSDQSCFGCGKDNPHGLHMTFSRRGQKVFSKLTIAEHLCGWSGLVHGGIITLVLDEIMSWTAIHLLQRLILTQSIQVDFLRPVRTGNALHLEAVIAERPDSRHAVVKAELHQDGEARCSARAQGRFALFSAAALQRHAVVDAKTIDDFAGFFNSVK